MDSKTQHSADNRPNEPRKGTLQAERLSSEEFQARVEAWIERRRRQFEADPEGKLPLEPPPDLGDPYLERILSHTIPCSEEEADEFVKSIYEGRGKDVSRFKDGMLPQD